MSQFTNRKFAGVLVSSVGLLAGSIGYATTLQDQVVHVLGEAHAAGTLQLPPNSFAVESVLALHKAEVSGDEVLLYLNGIPAYNAFSIGQGHKLALILHDTVSVLDQDTLFLSHPMIKSVTAALAEDGTSCNTKLVLEFNEAISFYQIQENGVESLVIQSKSDALTSRITGAVAGGQSLKISLVMTATPKNSNTMLALAQKSNVDMASLESQVKSIKPSSQSSNTLGFEGIGSVGTAKIDFLSFNPVHDAAADDPTDDDASYSRGGADDDASYDGVPDAPVEGATEFAPETQVEEVTAEDVPVEEEPQVVEVPMPRIEIAPITSGANADISSKLSEIQSGTAEDITGVELTGFASGTTVPVASGIVMDTSTPRFVGDPLEQLVNVDFREMDLSNVVALLSHKAGINVIAGTDLVGVVTANLRNVTLRRAMEEALRMNGLGLVEDGGIYRIVSLQEKYATDRVREIVAIDNTQAKEVENILRSVIAGSLEAPFINVSSNSQKNVVVISGPKNKVEELKVLAYALDTAEPKLQTVTELFKLNYADPDQVAKSLSAQLSKSGKIGVDARARQLVVTDEPFVVEHIGMLIAAMDVSVKQVVIETMIVDITLEDEASTGVDWLLSSVRNLNQRGEVIGSLQELGMGAALGIPNAASVLNFGVLSDNIDWSGVVQAEVRNANGRLHSNPVVVTMENKPARIAIAQEVPYIEFKQTDQGGNATNTEFKEIGTVLEVTPRVTHDNDIIVSVYIKESDTRGQLNGVPIEDVREMESELRTGNGQTIFIGGLRKNDQDASIRKVPVLGDIPVLNMMFRQNTRTEEVNELMVFMTNTVLEESLPELSGYEKMKFDGAMNAPLEVDAINSVLHDTIYPHEMRDPVWKFRRSE